MGSSKGLLMPTPSLGTGRRGEVANFSGTLLVTREISGHQASR